MLFFDFSLFFFFSLAGMCLEKISPISGSKYGHVEWLEQIKHCYEVAGDLGFLYLQHQDKQHTSNIFISSSTTGKLIVKYIIKVV